jgi:glutathione S-transferase
MKLIGSLTSPYVRKIRILLLEKQCAFEFVNDSPWEAATHVADVNPLGKVPALLSDSGEAFFDSPVIADYLEIIDSNTPHLPGDAMEAIRIKQLEALADGITDAGVAWLMEIRRPAEKQDPAPIARQRGKVERGLGVLEQRLAHSQYLYGDALSRADIATGCCLGFLDFRLPEYDWRGNHPALTAYASRLAARPSFTQTVPVL